MRVCVVVLNSIWYDPRVRKQLASYQENGVDVTAVGFKCRRYDVDKIHNIPCPTTIVEPNPRYIGRQRSILKKIIRENSNNHRLCDAIVAYHPDVIHANDLSTLVACVKAARKLKCRVIYDSHEICVENHHVQGVYKKYLAWIEKKYVKHIDRMVSVSHAAAQYFKERYKIPTPLVITNCSLLSERSFSKSKNEGFEVLNHGQYYAGRGYDIMVAAAPYLHEYPEIHIALRGFGSMEDQLRASAEKIGEQKVRFYPPVLVEELIFMASKSHVGVAITEDTCLNFRLSVSNKLFEYASAGLPVIMSDIPEHRYLNEKYEFRIIIPDNSPESFASAVIKLYTDKAFYEKCAENAKKLSMEVNWENEFGKLIEFERNISKA